MYGPLEHMTEPADAPRRPGRQRDPRTQAAILETTRRLLLSRGYHNLTFEAVATAASTSRSTVYRWWPTRGALVLDAAAGHLEIGLVPDTGDSREDLREGVRQLIDTFSDPLARIVILAAIANLDGDVAMASALRDQFVYPWRVSAADAIRRAKRRGDLPSPTDEEFILNVIVGTVFQCTVTVATPATDGLEDALLTLVLGQRTSPDGRAARRKPR